MSTLRSIVPCFLLLLSSSCLFADEFSEDRVSLLLGAGLVFSDEYHQVLEENLDLASGGKGWVTLQLGVSWRLTSRWQVLPSFEYLISPGQSEFGGDSFFNTVLLTKLAVRYSLTSTGGLYALGEVFLSSPDSELPELEFESGGTGSGLFVGFGAHQASVEIGIQQIPVDVHSARTGRASRDFGGLVIRTVVRR